MLVVQGALVVFGSAVASWLCFATLHADSSLQWRFPVACQVLLSALTLGSAVFAPESPRWLAKHQREDEARNVISQILDVSEYSPEVDGQLAEIIEAISAESLEEPSWREVFTNSTRTRNLQRTVLGMDGTVPHESAVGYKHSMSLSTSYKLIPFVRQIAN